MTSKFQYFSDGDKIYSVDMMIAYTRINTLPVERIPIADLAHVLEYAGWGTSSDKSKYSANDVLRKPHLKKYESEIERINNADLKFPIIVHKHVVVDGLHRLVKAKKNHHKCINAYRFDSATMRSFLVNAKGDWKYAWDLRAHDLIALFANNKRKRRTRSVTRKQIIN